MKKLSLLLLAALLFGSTPMQQLQAVRLEPATKVDAASQTDPGLEEEEEEQPEEVPQWRQPITYLKLMVAATTLALMNYLLRSKKKKERTPWPEGHDEGEMTTKLPTGEAGGGGGQTPGGGYPGPPVVPPPPYPGPAATARSGEQPAQGGADPDSPYFPYTSAPPYTGSGQPPTVPPGDSS